MNLREEENRLDWLENQMDDLSRFAARYRSHRRVLRRQDQRYWWLWRRLNLMADSEKYPWRFSPMTMAVLLAATLAAVAVVGVLIGG